MATPAPLPASGLTADEAQRRLRQFGQNAMPDTRQHSLRNTLAKFWAPVPWMLEAAIVLQVILGKIRRGGNHRGLLLFNAALGFFQESRAQATLTALKSRLAMSASVRRDGVWKTHACRGCWCREMSSNCPRRRGRRRRAYDRGKGPARSIHADRRVDPHRSWFRFSNLCRRPGTARRGGWPRSRRPECAPSSAARPSWSAPRMSSVHSKRRCSVWCGISPYSTASSSSPW
jgi:hypothetical protein